MSEFPSLTATFKGQRILCHNGQTADPLNAYSRALKSISGKRKKTDADFAEMAKIEWQAGLYVSKGEFIIPSHVLESAIIAGAKKSKNGVQAKCGIFVTDDAVLTFDGHPRKPATDEVLSDMFHSDNFKLTIGVKVGMSKVMRTRPLFRNWRAVFSFQYDPDVLNRSEIESILHDTGRLVGLCDWRPKYGRFTVEVI